MGSTTAMILDISIRAEQPGDALRIADLVRRAYADVDYSDHREHIMIERLRQSDAYVRSLSLLAEVGNQAVGHILLTRATIASAGSDTPSLALAPLSVVPEFQSRGVGSRLVAAAHHHAALLGFGSIVLIGIAPYYRRFGYEPLSRYPITLPFDAPLQDCMILGLAPGSLDGVQGQVRYAPEWLDH